MLEFAFKADISYPLVKHTNNAVKLETFLYDNLIKYGEYFIICCNPAFNETVRGETE